jgi:hypothetical protein
VLPFRNNTISEYPLDTLSVFYYQLVTGYVADFAPGIGILSRLPSALWLCLRLSYPGGMNEHYREAVSVRLEPPLRRFIEEKARRERRTLSNTVEVIVAAAAQDAEVAKSPNHATGVEAA